MRDKKLNLLIVDDEEQIRRVLIYILKEAGIADLNIIEAASAEEAIQRLKEVRADIIICDYILDNMNGIEFISKITSNYPETISILTSGNINFDELRDAVSKGLIFRFITKPFNEDEIISTIKEAIFKIQENLKKRDLLDRLKDF